MHNIPSNDIPYHQMVVQSSAQTYMPYRGQGFEVTVNPLLSDKRYVGGENNKLYPDIILWRPSTPGSNTGTAILVEQVETTGSINQNIDNWRRLATLQNVNFILVVPIQNVEYVRGILREQNIHPYKLQSYSYNPQTNNFTFAEAQL